MAWPNTFAARRALQRHPLFAESLDLATHGGMKRQIGYGLMGLALVGPAAGAERAHRPPAPGQYPAQARPVLPLGGRGLGRARRAGVSLARPGHLPRPGESGPSGRSDSAAPLDITDTTGTTGSPGTATGRRTRSRGARWRSAAASATAPAGRRDVTSMIIQNTPAGTIVPLPRAPHAG